jgi:hypothetical protein
MSVSWVKTPRRDDPLVAGSRAKTGKLLQIVSDVWRMQNVRWQAIDDDCCAAPLTDESWSTWVWHATAQRG